MGVVGQETNRKKLRFGHGDYERVLRNKTPASVEHARNFFLITISDIAPEVLDDLGKEPYMLYRRATGLCYEASKERREKKADRVARHIWTRDERPTWRDLEIPWRNPLLDAPFADELDADHPVHGAILSQQLGYVIQDPTPADEDGSIAAFKASLLEWSERHNLNDMWCRERAYATLDFWCDSPSSRKERFWYHEFAWHPPIAYRGDRPNFAFIFKYETQYPGTGHRQEVKQQILKACEEQLEDFLDRRKRAAQEAGMVATKQKQAKEHFEWLVLRQVKKPHMTCKQIFDVYQERCKSEDLPHVKTVRAVEKAVKELAELIGLTPRYAGRGRRPRAAAIRR